MKRQFTLFIIASLYSFSVGAIQYTYDDLNRLTRVAYDNGGRITYSYDAAGNIASIVKEIANISAPGAPSLGRLIPGNGFLRVLFSPPASNGGAAITSYTATCTGNGVTRTATGTSAPLTVTGLTNGLSYACSVQATNSAGSGAASASTTVAVKPRPSIAPILSIILD
jgi:YD repeat-containing protein